MHESTRQGRTRRLWASAAAALVAVSALALAAGPAGAQAETTTEHNPFSLVDPAYPAPCGGSPGLLVAEGSEVFHLTDTGRTFQLQVTTTLTFTFDSDDPAVPTTSGHAVAIHRESVNYAQLKDLRITDTIVSVAHSEDGTTLPIRTTITLLISPDGSVEVKVDSIKCAGQPLG